MNKFLILITLSFFLGLTFDVQAQDDKMEIYNSSGELIENGTFLFVTGGSSAKIINTDSLFIKNISDETIKLKVRKTEVIISSGTFSEFKALAQLIEPAETLTPNYWELEAGAVIPDSAYFLGSYYPQSIVATSSIIYSFLSVDDDDNVLDSVFVCYAYSTTSVTPSNENDGALYNKEILVNCDPAEINEYVIDLHNHSEETVWFRVGKDIQELEEGHEIYFKFGGVEYGAEVSSSDGNGVAIGADETLEGEVGFVAKFDPKGIDGNEFLSRVKYKFFNKLNGADADYVTLIYNPSGVGFGDLSTYAVSKAYPNPATTSFAVDYKLPEFVAANLKIYHSNGALIGQFPLQSQEGSVSVSTNGLSAGVYFYTIEIDDKILGVEKVVVK